MSYFARLAEQAGVTLPATKGASTVLTLATPADSGASAPFSNAEPDALEIDELIEVAAPALPTAAIPAPLPDPRLPPTAARNAAEIAESPLPPAPAAPQPRVVHNELAMPSPCAPTTAPRSRPSAADRVPVQAWPSLLKQALEWVASDPAQAFKAKAAQPSEADRPEVRGDAPALSPKTASQAFWPRFEPKDALVGTVQQRSPIQEAKVERTVPQAPAAIPPSPRVGDSTPADDALAPPVPPAKPEAQVEEVVQVSIGNIHVRVDAPAPSTPPNAAPAAPRPAPAHPPQAPAMRLRRRYLHV